MIYTTTPEQQLITTRHVSSGTGALPITVQFLCFKRKFLILIKNVIFSCYKHAGDFYTDTIFI